MVIKTQVTESCVSLDFSKVASLTAERIQSLYALLSFAFSDGLIDFEKLRAALVDIEEDSPKRYSFSWVGNRHATRQEAQLLTKENVLRLL